MSLENPLDMAAKRQQMPRGDSGRLKHPKDPVHADVKESYVRTLSLVERLHKLVLDVIKDEFDRLGRSDINSVQAYLLYNIGEHELTAGELRTRGFYLGSNVSYNLKKLVNSGHLSYERSKEDRRSVRVRLTDKGREIREVVDALYDRQLRSVESVAGLSASDFMGLNNQLQRLERFWADQIRFRL